MTDVTLGASGHWLGTWIGAGGTTILALALLAADHGSMEISTKLIIILWLPRTPWNN